MISSLGVVRLQYNFNGEHDGDGIRAGGLSGAGDGVLGTQSYLQVGEVNMSFKAFFSTNYGTSWATNALAFATREEAEQYASDLLLRWWAPTNYEVRESDEPVNYRWTNDGGATAIPQP